MPKYPAVLRDLAVTVDDGVAASDVEEAIRRADALVESAVLFDVFRGLTIAPGKKSLAFAIRYRDREGTLQDATVNSAHERVLKSLTERFGAQLR